MTVLEGKLTELKKQLFAMAGTVEGMVSASTRALVDRDAAVAGQVIEVEEERVNQWEIRIEDAAIRLIALHQPEASNLRTIMMIVKMNNDLERIGDHAVNIAQAALFLMERPQVKPLIDLPRMSDLTVAMLKDSLDSFIKGDVDLARDVCERDSVVDSLKDQINRELVTYMASDAGTIDRALKLMMISLNLERIADLATNIAEDAIYTAKGQVIKHHSDEQDD